MPQSVEFDEAAYLDANPDLQAALEAGLIESGLAHYTTFGRAERRPLITRKAWLRRGLDLKSMVGLEIGALSRPAIGKAEGDVLFIDFASRQTLAEKYSDDPDVVTDDLVDVDYLWTGGSLREVLGQERQIDYITASHVAEHVPNLLGWLASLRETLSLNGRIRLVIPDKRFTFDLIRAETTLADLIDASLRDVQVPTARQILDFMINARVVDCAAAWSDALVVDSLTPMSTPALAFQAAKVAVASGEYLDTHCWVFTPRSFARVMTEVVRLGLLDLRCEQLIETSHNGLEFFVELVRSDDRDEITRSWQLAAAVR